MKLAEQYLPSPLEVPNIEGTYPGEIARYIKEFRFNDALDFIWAYIQKADQTMTEREPFKVVKEDTQKGVQLIHELVQELYQIAHFLTPFMPATSESIKRAVRENKKPENLFPRL